MNFRARLLALLVIPFAFSACVKPSGDVTGDKTGAKSASGSSLAADAKTTESTKTEESTKTAKVSADPDKVSTTGAEPETPDLKPKKKLSELPKECQDIAAELRKLRPGIPLVFQELTRTAAAIDADVKKAIILGKKFLETCENCDESARVRVYLARDHLTRFKRHEEELEAQLKKELLPGGGKLSAEQGRDVKAQVKEMMGEYLGYVEELAKKGLAGSAVKSKDHCNGLGVLADRDYSFTFNNDSFRGYARDYIDNGCEKHFPTGQDYHYSIGMSFIADGQYHDALSHFEKSLKTRGDRPDKVLLNIGLFESHYALGALEDAEDLLARLKPEYRNAMDDTGMSRVLLGQYEQWYYISDFWIAFIQNALGNTEASLIRYKEYVDVADRLQHELQAAAPPKTIQPVIRIYRDFRARPTIEFIEQLHGKPSPLDFDNGVEWVSGEPTTIASQKGKIVAVMFRQPNNARSLDVLRHVDKMAKDNPKALTVISLGFIPRGLRADARESRYESMRQEIEALGLSTPGGFDVTDKNMVFRTLQAIVGTATLIVFDENGHPIWHHLDPTPNDVNVVDRVLGRLIKDRKTPSA